MWDGVKERIKLLGKFRQLGADVLYDYSDEVVDALKTNNATQLEQVLSTSKWEDHLKGFRLRSNTLDEKVLVSTPLLDIIENFPRIAGRLLFRMITVQLKENVDAGIGRVALEPSSLGPSFNITSFHRYRVAKP